MTYSGSRSNTCKRDSLNLGQKKSNIKELLSFPVFSMYFIFNTQPSLWHDLFRLHQWLNSTDSWDHTISWSHNLTDNLVAEVEGPGSSDQHLIFRLKWGSQGKEKCFFWVRAPSLPQGLDEQVPQKPEGLDLPLQLAVLKAKGSPIYCKQQSMFS